MAELTLTDCAMAGQFMVRAVRPLNFRCCFFLCGLSLEWRAIISLVSSEFYIAKIFDIFPSLELVSTLAVSPLHSPAPIHINSYMICVAQRSKIHTKPKQKTDYITYDQNKSSKRRRDEFKLHKLNMSSCFGI